MAYLSSTQTIREEIAARLNEAETDNTDQYTNWINQCTYDIQTDFPNAPFLRASADRTLSAGTRQYAVPSDYEKINDITFPGGDIKLAYLPPSQFDLLQPSASEAGNPAIYTIRGNDTNAIIEYYPSPGSSVTVHLEYEKLLGTVSAGSSTPPIPAKYYPLYPLFGEIMGMRRRGGMMSRRGPEWMFVQQQYDALKEKMREDLLYRTTDPLTIRSTRDFTHGRKTSIDPITQAFHQ